jgi:hypothetical protein
MNVNNIKAMYQNINFDIILDSTPCFGGSFLAEANLAEREAIYALEVKFKTEPFDSRRAQFLAVKLRRLLMRPGICTRIESSSRVAHFHRNFLSS